MSGINYIQCNLCRNQYFSTPDAFHTHLGTDCSGSNIQRNRQLREELIQVSNDRAEPTRNDYDDVDVNDYVADPVSDSEPMDVDSSSKNIKKTHRTFINNNMLDVENNANPVIFVYQDPEALSPLHKAALKIYRLANEYLIPRQFQRDVANIINTDILAPLGPIANG